MDFEQIEDKIIEALRADGRLKTVEAGRFEGVKNLPLRLPAAFVSYDGSKYEWLHGGRYAESVVFSIIVADKDLRGEGAYGLVRDVIGSLANADFELGIRPLRPVKALSVKTESPVSAYRIDFETGFDNSFSEETAVKSCHVNILESSTVTLSAGMEDANYPLYRLYDRNIGRIFKAVAASTTTVKIDQGAAPISVDRLVVPAGHNLSGVTLGIKHSEDDITYTDAVAPFTAGAGLIEKSWEPVARRYWRFEINSPSVAPEITELFLTSAYEWEIQPRFPREAAEVFNIENETSISGQDRFLIHGEPKRRLYYRLSGCGKEQKDKLDELFGAWAGCRPFYLYGHDGDWVFVKLSGPVEVRETGFETYDAEIEFTEVLP